MNSSGGITQTQLDQSFEVFLARILEANQKQIDTSLAMGFGEFRKELRAEFATKDDLKTFATKDDLKELATKKDLAGFATKKDFNHLTSEIVSMKREIGDTLSILQDFIVQVDNRFNRLETKLDKQARQYERRFATNEMDIKLLKKAIA